MDCLTILTFGRVLVIAVLAKTSMEIVEDELLVCMRVFVAAFRYAPF